MESLIINFKRIPAQAKIMKGEALQRKWSTKEPEKLVHQVIDNMETSGFEKIKIKKTINTFIDLFEPTSITITEKEEI